MPDGRQLLAFSPSSQTTGPGSRMALMVINGTWLYLSSLVIPWKRRPLNRSFTQFPGLRVAGSRRTMLGICFTKRTACSPFRTRIRSASTWKWRASRDAFYRVVHRATIVPLLCHGSLKVPSSGRISDLAAEDRVENDFPAAAMKLLGAHRNLKPGINFLGDHRPRPHTCRRRAPNFLPARADKRRW